MIKDAAGAAFGEVVGHDAHVTRPSDYSGEQ